jgi:hypothetical protein
VHVFLRHISHNVYYGKLMKKEILKKTAILILVLFSFTITQTANSDVFKTEYALPPDLQIVKPDADVPPELALFSGAWVGQWRKSPCLYVIEKITHNRAVVVYSQIPGHGGESKWTRYTKCEVVKLENGNYTIQIRGNLGSVTQFRLTQNPNYIQGIRWGVNYKYDNVPINFKKWEQ